MNILLTLVAPLAFAAAPALAQDPVQDRRPEIKELIAEFEGHVRARGDRDAEAVGVVDKLLTEFEASGPKDRAAIAKSLGTAHVERRKETSDGQPDERLAIAAATALGRMGDDGGDVLLKNLEHKNLRDRPTARRATILGLGQTRHPKGAKPLADLLTNHEAAVQAAAAEALGHYAESDQKVRKDAFKALLDVIVPLASKVSTDTTDQEAKARFDAISTSFLGSMRRLSGADEADFPAWQRWWNHNKNRDWTTS